MQAPLGGGAGDDDDDDDADDERRLQAALVGARVSAPWRGAGNDDDDGDDDNDDDGDGDDGDGDDDDWRSIHRFRDRTNQVTSAYLHQLHTCIDKKVRTCISQEWETLLPCPLGL